MNWMWWRRRRTIVVLDDFFPNLLTGFRVAEYNALFSSFPNVRVLSAYPDFDQCLASYARSYPQYATRIHAYQPSTLSNFGLAYLNFLNNAIYFLDDLESLQIPFVLTLYPGGGFGLNDMESDAKLERVLRSSLLKAVIVTQPVTKEYLSGRNQHEVPVYLIPGVVVNPAYFDCFQIRPIRNDEILNVCFVAEKYMTHGLNKGYPVFVQAARQLSAQCRQVRFHIVGGFDKEDIDVGDLGDNFLFYGRLMTKELRAFLFEMDVIVSPNQPFVLHPGNFDGFPTGCCVEASLCGVTIVATDSLNQNPGYQNGKEIIIVPPLATEIANTLQNLAENREICAEIGARGNTVTKRLYSPSLQIDPRIAIIRKVAADCRILC